MSMNSEKKSIKADELVLTGNGDDEKISSIAWPKGLLIGSAQSVEVNIDSNDVPGSVGDDFIVTKGKSRTPLVTVNELHGITLHELPVLPDGMTAVDVVIGEDKKLYRKA
jgi:hypothetical protein